MKKSIAVLLACHNRKEKTTACLSALYRCQLHSNYTFTVFLVDDNSTDGTADAINNFFPEVNIIKGNGQLFWNKGMRLAWESAVKVKNFDFYFWLNDDTILDELALSKLMETYDEALNLDKEAVIITAACRKENNSYEFSYGGRNNEGPILPNGNLQRCIYINGNAVLVPQKIYNSIGNLSNDYSHAMGDNDYGLRAIQNGFSCYTTKEYIATCAPNNGIPGWCNSSLPIKKRWKLFHSPLGLNIKEYKLYVKKFTPKRYYSTVFKAYAKCVFPNIYNSLKKN